MGRQQATACKVLFYPFIPREVRDMAFEWALLEHRHPKGESCSLGLSGGLGSDPGALL